MKIELHNFFRYYNHNLPKHQEAVDDLIRALEEKAPELLQDQANWVRIYRAPATPSKPSGILLDVPWYPQTDNYALPDSTCNSSACAMVLEYFKPDTLKGPKGDDAYLRKVLSIGKSTDQSVQTKALQSYGLQSEFRYNLDFDELEKQIKNRKPVVMGILHRGPIYNPTRNSGHMIVCIGLTDKGDLIVNDPYGSLLNSYTGPVTQGKGVVYSRKEMQARWTVDGDKTGWGRIFK